MYLVSRWNYLLKYVTAAALMLGTSLVLPLAAQAEDAGPATQVAAAAPTAAITEPTDPIAKAAFDALADNCARCHQAGKLLPGKLTPSGKFGFVLQLTDLVGAPKQYVVPGNPDASLIVQKIQNEEMPYDYFGGGTPPAGVHPVSAEQLAAIRNWITSLSTAAKDPCATRTFVTPDSEVAAMQNDLEALDPTRVADTRYLVLTHLYNSCATDEAMEAYRQGAVKLLNSLSTQSDVVRLETIDPARTIIRFNLQDLGWDESKWDLLLANYPYGAVPHTPVANIIAGMTKTPLAFIDADWFAFTASRPGIYEKLLDIPPTFAELQKYLGLDVTKDIDDAHMKRAGFQHSGVSASNRLIERHLIASGYFWTSYDFAGNREHQDLFENPTGPGTGPTDFSPDGGETIFSLPNGFQAYYINNNKGELLQEGLTTIVRDPARRDGAVTNGISCMGCHANGMNPATDQIRAVVTGSNTFPVEVRDEVRAAFPEKASMDATINGDTNRFQNAERAAGLDPALRLHDVEVINALSDRYEADLDIKLVAAIFGQDKDTFLKSLASAGDPKATRLARRLSQDVIPRDDFEKEFDALVPAVSQLDVANLHDAPLPADYATVTPPTPAPIAPSDLRLSVIADKPAYGVGDLVHLTINASQPCFLTLLDVDLKGTATLIFPNKFQQDNHIAGGGDIAIPGQGAKFKYQMSDAGVETVIATCSIDNKPVDGAVPNFSQTYTNLGNYQESLTRSMAVLADNQSGAPPAPVHAAGSIARAVLKLTVQ